MYETIKINNTEFPRPLKFKPQREDVIKAEYTTNSGRRVGDIVGWRYSDITLEWGALPQSKVEVLINDANPRLIFDDPTGEKNEEVIRTSIVQMRHPYLIDGVTYWKEVSVSYKFVIMHEV